MKIEIKEILSTSRYLQDLDYSKEVFSSLDICCIVKQIYPFIGNDPHDVRTIDVFTFIDAMKNGQYYVEFN